MTDGAESFDVINGAPLQRERLDVPIGAGDLDSLTGPDEQAWEEERRRFLRYD